MHSGVLIISDWELGQIISFNPLNNERNVLVSNLLEPLGIIYSTTSLVLDDAVLEEEGICEGEPCTELCITDADQHPSCRCPNVWADISDLSSCTGEWSRI